MKDDETLVLVETMTVDRIGGKEFDEPKTVIMRIIRTYTDPKRADDDLALLKESDPTTTYELVTVPYFEK